MKLDPFSMLYLSATAARNILFNTGLFSARLRGPVVSVGSLSAGGAGKTPLVLWLGEQLKQRRVRFDVLSRGYRRRTRGVLLVDPQGEAAEFGDEPLLLARRLNVPVLVGENRYHTGILAEQKFGPHLHLLDDGFQHRGLVRDLDLVLITQQDLEDSLLPFGRLREPLTSLYRADALVLMDDVTEKEARAFDRFGKPVWWARRGLALPASVPQRPLAFCGIARPQNFFTVLRAAGVERAWEAVFRDHHAYGEGDVRELLRLKSEKGCGGFITTEKDIINLGRHASSLTPLAVAQLTFGVENADALLDRVVSLAGAAPKPALVVR